MKSNSTNAILEAYKKFERQISPIIPSLLKGDDEFNNAAFKRYLDERGTNIRTHVSKDDHIGNGGDSLGIADRFISTLRKMMTQYFLVHNTTDWVDGALPAVLSTYNDDQTHSSVGVPPSEAFHNSNDLIALRLGDQEYNANFNAPESFPMDTMVRIVKPRGTFDKGSEAFHLSLQRYRIVGFKGGKYQLEGQSRLYKPSEVVRSRDQSTYEQPVSEAPPHPIEQDRAEARAANRFQKEGLDRPSSRPQRSRKLRPRKPSNPKLDMFDSSSDDED